jgi:hypothetical protein
VPSGPKKLFEQKQYPLILISSFVFRGAHQLPAFHIPALEKLSKGDIPCGVTILAVFELAAIINEESEATIRVPGLFFVVVSIEGARSELGSTAR